MGFGGLGRGVPPGWGRTRAGGMADFRRVASFRQAVFTVLCALAIGLALGPDLAAGSEEGVEAYALENGLRVRLRPVEGATRVGALLLLDIGHEHDPEGRSGLTHLIEHLFVTCATESLPARTAEELMAQYPMAWNAQTGARHTVVYLEAPAAQGGRLLEELATRMGSLRITQEELDRERERVLVEVEGMFEGAPGLAAFNHARERALPSAHAGRRGGAPEQVRGIGLEVVREFWARHYKPRNARLVVAGGFDAGALREQVAARFGGLAAGEPVPAPAPRGAAPGPELVTVPALRIPALPDRQLVLAWRVPASDHALFPAFVCAVSRLLLGSGDHLLASRMFPPPVYWAPLDDPEVLYLSSLPGPDQDPAEAARALERRVAEALARPASDPAREPQPLAYLLGTVTGPEHLLAQNLYGLALGLGRREQWGLDARALGRRIAEVTDEDLAALGREWLAPARRAAVLAVSR